MKNLIFVLCAFLFALNAYAKDECSNNWNVYTEDQSLDFKSSTAAQVLKYYHDAVLKATSSDIKAKDKKELYPIPYKTMEGKELRYLRYLGDIYLLNIKSINEIHCLYKHGLAGILFQENNSDKRKAIIENFQSVFDYLSAYHSVSVDSYLRINGEISKRTNGAMYLFKGDRAVIESATFELYDAENVYYDVLAHVDYYMQGNGNSPDFNHSKHVVGHLMEHILDTIDKLNKAQSKIDLFQYNQSRILAEKLLDETCPSRKNKS